MSTGAWECHQCTFSNSSSTDTCEVCNAVSPFSVLSDEESTDSVDAEIKSHVWICQRCTLENDISLTNCAACNCISQEGLKELAEKELEASDDMPEERPKNKETSKKKKLVAVENDDVEELSADEEYNSEDKKSVSDESSEEEFENKKKRKRTVATKKTSSKKKEPRLESKIAKRTGKPIAVKRKASISVQSTEKTRLETKDVFVPIQLSHPSDSTSCRPAPTASKARAGTLPTPGLLSLGAIVPVDSKSPLSMQAPAVILSPQISVPLIPKPSHAIPTIPVTEPIVSSNVSVGSKEHSSPQLQSEPSTTNSKRQKKFDLSRQQVVDIFNSISKGAACLV